MEAAGWSVGAVSAAQAGIIMVGSTLINAVFPPPGQPNSAGFSTGSPTYALGAQGNQARLGAPIPVNYGKMRIYPDFAARPYTEYESNEQYLYQLFCIGQGWNDISNIRLDNTPIENFEEATVEIVNPHEPVTLFHTAVVLAPEAGGQDLSEPITLGPYVINNKDTEISRVACDVVFPAGLIHVDDSNNEKSTSVHLRVWVDPIDDDNIAGSPITVWDQSITDKTRTAIRLTFGKDVEPDRYQMSIQRTTSIADKSEVKNCSLGAMKGYLVDNNEYGDVTLLAMRVRATANLSDSASRLVNVISERRIPTWDPDGGWTIGPVLTRNPAWAFADAIRSRYGGDFSDSEIDLNGLHYLAGLFDARGDTFDGRFDTDNNLWDALMRIGQVCRSGPIRQGNLYRMIRDQHQSAPVQVFGMSNMADFSIDYVMHDDHTADSVKVTYWDEARDYVETTITAQLPDDSNDNPQEITLFGCTHYEQAWREGMYLAASNRERRQMVSWTTGLEGHIPTFGDLVWVNHDLLGTGQQFGGTVAAVDGEVLTLSRDVNLSGSDKGETWYIVIRDRYGGPSPPIPIEAVDSHRVRLLDTIPDIETDPTREPSHFMIGQGSRYAFPVKITAITPEADDRVAIAGCIESEFVHTADEGEIPAPPPDFKPPPPGLEIEDLRATQGGTTDRPAIYLSWAFSSGADHYQIETRLADSDLWQPAGTGLSLVNQHEFVSEPGEMVCRVAAVAAVRGPWAEIPVDAGGDFDTPGQVDIQLSEPFEGEAMRVQWTPEPAAARYLLEVHSNDRYRRGLYLDRDITTYEYHWQDAEKDSAGRTITIQVKAINAEEVQGLWGEVTATNEPPDAPTSVSAIGILNSILVQCDYNYDEDIRELRVYGAQKADFVPSPANLLAAEHASLLSVPVETHSHWFLRLAWVDYWGATDLNFSGVVESEVGPITETEIGPDSISTPMLKANSIVAEKIAADAITGREISSATTITAGSGNSTAGMNGVNTGDEIGADGIRFWSGAPLDGARKAPFFVRDDGFMSVSAMTASGNIDSSSITSSDISGTDIRASTIEAGSEITGSTISGGVIFGAVIYAAEQLYLADPSGNGSIYYYQDYPDVPLACEEILHERKEHHVGNDRWEAYRFSFIPSAYREGSINNNRVRFATLLPIILLHINPMSGQFEYHIELRDIQTGELIQTTGGNTLRGSDTRRHIIGKTQFTASLNDQGLSGGAIQIQTEQDFGSLYDPQHNGLIQIQYNVKYGTGTALITFDLDNSVAW